ncbi:MAG: HXXEE domain-containing protein [Candidatus Schekmanbacteria bacterium]|nr:HXXEE domain-containing protein [Candidatus Schekmanbacteria bacterium]
MSGEVQSYLTGTLGLSMLLALSIGLTVARPRIAREPRIVARASLVAALAIAAQLLHFIEELSTRFYERFPSLLGLEPWGARFFVAFNVTWLVLWAASVLGIRAGVVAALVPLWFLGLALALNAAAHPVLALRVGGYFPGLFTAPVVGVAGVVLLGELVRLTRCGWRAA